MSINVNEAACVGCRICMLVCANRAKRHAGEMQSSRIRVKERESLVGHDVIVCVQCSDHPCINSCPTEALSIDKNTGAVIVNEETCTACESCVSACPYNAIVILDSIASICDLCGGDPACVTACPVDAIMLEKN